MHNGKNIVDAFSLDSNGESVLHLETEQHQHCVLQGIQVAAADSP